MIKYILIIILGIIILFIWWLYIGVQRGAVKRDEKIYKEIAFIEEKIDNNEVVNAEEIEKIAEKAYIRPLLYIILKNYEKLDLFPSKYLEHKFQAESELSYWLAHPNELQTPPDKIELCKVVKKNIDNKIMDFYVFRFCSNPPHWAAQDGWLLGVAGPYSCDTIPYSGAPATFSRLDKESEVNPEELVDWIIQQN